MTVRLEDVTRGALLGSVTGDDDLSIVAALWIGSSPQQLTCRTGWLNELAVYISAPRLPQEQTEAVYGELLKCTPLRVPLTDERNAEKIIVAELHVKEVMLCGEPERCLCVTPVSLLEQRFELRTRQPATSAMDGSLFIQFLLLIPRRDQLSRSSGPRHQPDRGDLDLTA